MERSKKRVDALLLAFTAWMADRNPRPLRPITRRQYVWAVRRAFLFAAEGDYSLLVGDKRVVRFVLAKSPPHPASQTHMLNALKAFYDFLKSQGVRKDNPTSEIGRPPRHQTYPRPLALENCCAFLDAASRLTLQHYAIAALGLLMGLRSGEIRTLRYTDFFEANDRMWCDVDGKGGRRGRVPVHSIVRQIVPRLQQENPHSPFLFPSTVRARYGQLAAGATWIRSRHLETIAEAGLEHFTPHQLRHSFATYLRRTGVDIAVVQKGLRHSSLQSTQIYTAVLDDELADAIDRLDFRAAQ